MAHSDLHPASSSPQRDVILAAVQRAHRQRSEAVAALAATLWHALTGRSPSPGMGTLRPAE